MKRIDDASEEMKDIFEQVWKINTTGRSQHLGDREMAEHFFMTGVSSARVLYGLMLNKKTKREIKTVISDAENVYALSSDGKLYALLTDARWIAYPDLPQN